MIYFTFVFYVRVHRCDMWSFSQPICYLGDFVYGLLVLWFCGRMWRRQNKNVSGSCYGSFTVEPLVRIVIRGWNFVSVNFEPDLCYDKLTLFVMLKFRNTNLYQKEIIFFYVIFFYERWQLWSFKFYDINSSWTQEQFQEKGVRGHDPSPLNQ